MTTLAEDLILLTVGMRPKIGPETGTLPQRVRFGLRGAELVTLAQAGRVEVVQNRIVVRNPAPTGDQALDWLLGGLAQNKIPPLAKDWVGTAQLGHTKYYFERLATAGALKPVSYRLLLLVRVTAYVLADQNAFLDARRRLDAAVLGPGPVDAAETALAGMVYAAGLDEICFPGNENQAARDRLKFMADPNVRAAAAAVAAARLPRPDQTPYPYPDPNLLWQQQQQWDQVNQAPNQAGADAARHAAAQAAAQAAGAAAVHAGAQAAGDAAVHAAVHAATTAAVSASVQAAVSAATAASAESHHHYSSTSSSDGGSSHHHSSSSSSGDSGGGGGHHH
ncbi:MAG TPA: GPP34 family phosphoprotein [Actinocrinis sp.]|nr:GPP34 family phosphoprotein [Actinocrinis sp.]